MVPCPPDPRWSPDDGLAADLAQRFGTPLYVVNEAHFRATIRNYRQAFSAVEPGGELTFASKANSVCGILRIAWQEGCRIDCASAGELMAALQAGIPAADCHLHGNNKSAFEIEFAIQSGIGQIVVDNSGELRHLAEIGCQTELMLRLAPGVLPVTNEKISTGQQDTKFGFSILGGQAEEAVQFCLDRGLNLAGFHCHVGSQLLDPVAQIEAGKKLAEFALHMKAMCGFEARVLNLGGGRAVRYTDELPMPVADYCAELSRGVRDALSLGGLFPKLVQEPGRSLIAECGVTLYRVGVVKDVPLPDGASRRYVVVDGGLADNPRPALYGAAYAAYVVGKTPPNHPTRVSGRHCESDMLIAEADLPADTAPGDVLVTLSTGAYSSSMASNYNRYPRPATVLVRENGGVDILQKAETWQDLLSRECLPEDL
ncbi:MAG: diaminopimelate decarboxylase [Armatimonadetes bacterium]|nr:diaminopimelate decarboxylase [Armatimonadota bacterium]